MSSETHAANLTLLMNLSSVYIFQYVAQDPKLSTVTITWLVNGIVQKLWSKEVHSCSLSCGCLGDLLSPLHSNSFVKLARV